MDSRSTSTVCSDERKTPLAVEAVVFIVFLKVVVIIVAETVKTIVVEVETEVMFVVVSMVAEVIVDSSRDSR